MDSPPFTQKDKDAFQSLFESYYDRLLAFAYTYIRNKEEVRDLVQEAFISLWERVEDLSPDTNLYAYLLTSVRNKCLNHLRGKKLKEQYARKTHSAYLRELEFQSKGLEALPLQKLIDKEQRNQLHKVIDELPEQARKVFAMRFFAHLKNTEIAQELGLSEKTVRNLLSISLKTLQLKLHNPALLLLLAFISKDLH